MVLAGEPGEEEHGEDEGDPWKPQNSSTSRPCCPPSKFVGGCLDMDAICELLICG